MAGNMNSTDLATSRAGATSDFQGGMGKTLKDLYVRRDTYAEEIDNDYDVIYQLELELAVSQQMSDELDARIKRRDKSHHEFVETLAMALQASKKLKAATNSLIGICKK